MTDKPKFAGHVQVENGTTRHVYIDGQEFPYFTDGIHVEIDGNGLRYLNARIPITSHEFIVDRAGARDEDFPLGQACSITDPDCEACQ